MPTPTPPLFFPQALESPGHWTDLGKTYGLTRKDFEWFSHLKLATHALRNQQTPPMLAEKILVSTGTLYLPLAGCFVLSSTPDENGEILYTPYAGIKKFAGRSALTDDIKRQLDDADEDDGLLAFMSLSARKTLAAATDITVTFETIDGDVFDDQRTIIENNQRLNDQAMVDELQNLPTLVALLDTVLAQLLKPTFAGLDQRRTQVGFYTETDSQSATSRRWVSSMSMSEALLSYYRHQRWPTGLRPEFSHPQRTPLSADQQHWETAIKNAADSLIGQLSVQLQRFWNEASVDGATRRAFFTRAIREKARADLLLKREAEIISPEQSSTLHAMIESTTGTSPTLVLETVRLWEYQPNSVELAGSLMISQDSANAFLYTPAKGLLVLKDYQDLKDTLRKKSIVAGHDDELYDLMSLEERSLFIGFDEPHVSGAVISGSIFTTLFEAIITKQLQNTEYAFQVFRHSDGAVNIQAYFDKALDIRSMIDERLLAQEDQGRWSTRPLLSGEQPSMVLGDTAAGFVKTFQSVEGLIREEFELQPLGSSALQRYHLTSMKPRLSYALSVGVRGEATLRELGGTLRNADWVIVDTVFNPERPDRHRRPAVRGFHPDAFSLVLDCAGEKDVVRLANCILLTERGGLDVQHSGRAILWTPGAGLEVFETVASARQQLNLRLLDPDKRLVLLENLSPIQRKHHRRYSLNSLRLIEGDVLQFLVQSGVDLFLARCEHVRALKLTDAQQSTALQTLTKTVIDTNLPRATLIARAISQRQSMPAWLGLAPVEEQKLHIELLEQYRHSVTDDKDYLHGMQTVEEYVRQTLKTLLTARFPKESIDPDMIEITPNLALAGPAQTLTQFALNHINIAQGTGFRVSSTGRQTLPEDLNQTAVKQLLLSLNIPRDYAKQVTEALSGTTAAARQLRFVQQVPWQLLQHAHALKLQRQLSANAFDLIFQVLDMPDAIARSTVAGAHAIVRPLEIIKTAGATAVQAKGLYLIGPGTGKQGSHILYASYSEGSVFTEFASETDIVAAINTPGALQDLIVRRLPESEQASFRNLLQSSIGELSELTLASTPIDGNLLAQLFSDNTSVLAQMLGSQSHIAGQSDWEAAKQLFSSGIKLISGHLPGKLAYVRFLWQAFEDFDDSAEALQDHHWTRALERFIAGAAQMVTLGELSLEDLADSAPPPATTAPVKTPVADPQWAKINPTAPTRTQLQPFEASTVSLKDLTKKAAEGTYVDPVSKLRFAPVAGKVYEVAKPGAVWQINKAGVSGPSLVKTPSQQLALDPDRHTVHFGKAMSKMINAYAADRDVNRVFNIEARGMTNIRALHPHKARAIVEAIDMARYYAFNSLHNLAQARSLAKGTRLDNFLRAFFDVAQVDTNLLEKIGQVIVPICKALVDENDELWNSERFITGSIVPALADTSAFVVDYDKRKHVHFTEKFFDQQLDLYDAFLTEPFDVDGHAQAAVLIHEFAHQYSGAKDFVYLEARRPFSDLIATVTSLGAALKQTQETFQREALSLATPRDELFARWNSTLQSWVSLDSIDGAEHVGREILKITGCQTMDDARTAFRNPVDAAPRIATILRNADSIAHLICQLGRQLDPAPPSTP
ncbi:dermonecrotic toxin domain-containing protein [Pseudomonas sp. ZT5P21]